MERNARKFNNFPTPPTRDDYDFLINFPHWIKSVSGNFPLGNDENCLSPFEKGKHLLRVGKSMLKLLKCMKRRSRRRSKKTRMLMTLSDRYVCAIKNMFCANRQASAVGLNRKMENACLEEWKVKRFSIWMERPKEFAKQQIFYIRNI